MRFKKGSKVEVFNKTGVPSGSWRSAEIVSGNGHTYLVRYDCYLTSMTAALERVPRKAIRPCPPSVEGHSCWVSGNIVEVLNNYSWKIAEVVKGIGLDYFLVRPLGTSMGFEVHSSEIRLRQIWQDKIWPVIQKDSVKFYDGKLKMLPRGGRSFCRKTKAALEDINCADGHWTIQTNNVLPQDFTKYTRKRLYGGSLLSETCIGARKKTRWMEKAGRCRRLIASQLANLHEKVDAVASPQKLLGEKYMHASLNDRKMGFPDTCYGGDGLTNADYNSYCSVGSEHGDTESVCSSVDSCCASNSPYRPVYYPVNDLARDLDGSSGSAAASWSGRVLSLPAKEAEGEDIHELELHAYKATLLALYASGPISWDQEALMTNLRCMLHISNDEHLVEVRNLVSAEKDVSFR